MSVDLYKKKLVSIYVYQRLKYFKVNLNKNIVFFSFLGKKQKLISLFTRIQNCFFLTIRKHILVYLLLAKQFNLVQNLFGSSFIIVLNNLEITTFFFDSLIKNSFIFIHGFFNNFNYVTSYSYKYIKKEPAANFLCLWLFLFFLRWYRFFYFILNFKFCITLNIFYYIFFLEISRLE